MMAALPWTMWALVGIGAATTLILIVVGVCWLLNAAWDVALLFWALAVSAWTDMTVRPAFRETRPFNLGELVQPPHSTFIGKHRHPYPYVWRNQ
jgi:hypothetical protein